MFDKMFLFIFFLLSFFLLYNYLTINFVKYNKLMISTVFSIILVLLVFLLFTFNLINQLSNNQVITIYFFNSFYYILGVDKLSIIFIILTSLLFVLCFIYNMKNILVKLHTWFFIIITMYLGLTLTFLSQDLILFLVGFEFVLIPLFWIVIEFGSRSNKLFASYFLVIITLFGSCFFLIALFLIYIETSNISFQLLTMYSLMLSESRQSLIWLFLLLGFFVKIPILPLHLWLPEAHGEAPTIGSVLLAGVVLKLGTYGIIRCLVFIFFNAEVYFSSILIVIGLLNMLYAAIVSIIQLDMKKAIAYGSVAHIGLVVAGFSELNPLNESGCMLIMLFHGVVSPLLFFIIGSLYERIATRNHYYFGSLAVFSPLLSLNLFFGILANVAFPGTASFVGELQVLSALVISNPVIGLLIIFCTFVNLIWNFLLMIRIIFISVKSWTIFYFYDISLKEFVIFTILNVLSIFAGIFVIDFLNFFEYSFYYI